MMIEGLERSFYFNGDTVYLDHGGFGVAPREVLDFGVKARQMVEGAPRCFFDSDYRPRWREAAGKVASWFSARIGDLALVDNVTDAVNAVLRSIPFRSGDEILISSMTYGAVANATKHIANEKGARVVEARLPFPNPSAEGCISAILATITRRTRLAILDHITSATALVLPIVEMTRACHALGVMVLVDGAHVPGNLALDIPSIGADW